MSSDSLPDFDEWLADVGWLPISYEAIGARRAWDYLSAAAEARAAVPSSHVSETDEPKHSLTAGEQRALKSALIDSVKVLPGNESILREALALAAETMEQLQVAMGGRPYLEGIARKGARAARSALAGMP